MNCKNHPQRETNVACASCGEGICPDCMVVTPVGMKCPDCARPTRGMVRQGKPSQYAGALIAGLLTSFIGGLILSFSFRGSIIVSILLGYLIGLAVRRGAMGNKGPTFAAIAAGTTVAGLLIAGYGLSPMGFLFLAITAGVAAYQLS